LCKAKQKTRFEPNLFNQLRNSFNENEVGPFAERIIGFAEKISPWRQNSLSLHQKKGKKGISGCPQTHIRQSGDSVRTGYNK